MMQSSRRRLTANNMLFQYIKQGQSLDGESKVDWCFLWVTYG